MKFKDIVIKTNSMRCPTCTYTKYRHGSNVIYCDHYPNVPVPSIFGVDLTYDRYHFSYIITSEILTYNYKDTSFKYIESKDHNKSYICFNTKYYRKINANSNDSTLAEFFPHIFEFHINFIDEFPYISKETLEKIKSKKDLYIFQ